MDKIDIKKYGKIRSQTFLGKYKFYGSFLNIIKL